MGELAPPVRRVARFELLRELGRGAQAQVWLAYDPRLEREVALKLLDPTADVADVSEWLHEARAVSRLTHPNIVPVFEADADGAAPYLVFEYVEGPTLAEARRGRAVWPAREAAALVLGVLDALAAAHAQGIVHRDLKPSNILLGRDGRARVMDFGIAARTAQVDGRIVGTPGYISPEAARGDAPVPAMDVFAAGVMLGELLCGAPLLRESDPLRAVARVQAEDLLLPPDTRVDDALRGIVQRALARDLGTRYDGARAMHVALTAWLHPQPAEVPGAAAEAGKHATLEFLLRRMRHKSDFPALSASVLRIQRVAASESESLQALSDEILKDVALTNKLLRMVNSAHFSTAAGGGIGTVSRAVALVGFAGIRNMAMAVLLLEHMNDKRHAAQLKEEFLRALMAGSLASELSPRTREGEEAFLGAMLQNLGRLLTEYYFPDEAMQIREQMGARGSTDRDTDAAREAAARRVLGLSLQDLGSGVARAWGLPESLQLALRAPDGAPPSRALGAGPQRGVEHLRWLGRCANAVADALLATDSQAQAAALHDVAERHAPALALAPGAIVKAAHIAQAQVARLAQALGLEVGAQAPARRLMGQPGATVALAANAIDAVAPERTLVLPGEPGSPRAQLQQGLDAVCAAKAGNSLRLNELLNLVLETMQRALDFRHVVLCLREPRTGCLVGRVGIGCGADEISAAFRVPTGAKAGSELFAALCAKGADLLIADASTVAHKLPTWFKVHVRAPTFVVLPLVVKGSAIGLIYADKAQAGSIVMGDAELGLLRALRDQAVSAFDRGA
jgi:serine/threonine protein kinase